MSDTAYVTANGYPVMRAEILRPRVGNWHADLTIDTRDATPFRGAVEIVIIDTIHLKGTSLRAGTHHDTTFVRIVGGAGGLATLLSPKAYQNAPLRIPLSDCLSLAGETLSVATDPAALSVLLPKWVRPQHTAGAELAALVQASGAQAWRVLSDGSIWLGPETWPKAALDYQEIEYEPQLARLEFASDLPTIAPGASWPDVPDEPYGGRPISMIRHLVTPEAIRHFAWFEDDGASSDRAKAGLDGYLAVSVLPRLDRLAGYWAVVVSQNADGTLELQPDSPRIPGLSNVPIRYGLPGITATIAPGARVLLEFAEGDFTRPMATVWDVSTATEIKIGGTTVEPAALASTLTTFLGTTLKAWLDTHVHSGVTAGAALTGPPQGAGGLSPSTPNISSSVVKVKV